MVAGVSTWGHAHAERNLDSQDPAPLFKRQAWSPNHLRKWWVLYTKSRQEKALAHHLSARHIPHYLPLYEKHSLIRGRRFKAHVPLFSGYVFLFGDAYERIGALESNRVARTIDVPDGRQAELVSDLLRLEFVIESGVRMGLECHIEAGQRVRVKSGRLAGLEGTVTERRGGTRLLIVVNYLQQGASIEIDDFALEVI